MYDDILTGVSENIEIMGYPFYAENIQGEEPFNRREIIQKPLLNGTMITKRGRYVQRKFSFKTTLFHGDGRADAHDDILREINSKPVEVISQSMGGKFKAVVTFTKDIFEGSPFHTDYDVDIIEVPESSSNIPGENRLVVPEVKKVSVSNTTNSSSKINTELNNQLNNQLNKCNVPYKDGQKNECVKILQEKLILLGYLDEKYKTGRYDNRTIEAVKSFQRSTNGKLLVDGVFGMYTRLHLVKT